MPQRPADFPFYNGAPIALRPKQWALLMLSVAIGFACLIVPIPGPQPLSRILRALLFPAIPLLTLRAIAGPHWLALFPRPTFRQLIAALGFALLNIAVTITIGLAVQHWLGANENPAMQPLIAASASDRVVFFLLTIPQLLGEEVLTMLPFLALLTLFTQAARLSRRQAIVLSWLLSAVLFGMLHLPTYGWNWAQCLLVIGTARLVLTLAYLWSRSLWVSTTAHILNDWILFGTAILAGPLKPP